MANLPQILKLDPCHAFGERERKKRRKDNLHLIDQYELEHLDLNQYDCLFVTDFVDQEFLYEQRKKIEAFLQQRKVVIFCGHLFRKWLPGASLFLPKKINHYKDYEVCIAEEHPIFQGVDPYDMTYNKGVAGFFARGYHPLPEGAQVLLAFKDNTPITYIDRQSTPGTILVHAGRDLLAYENQQKTTDRISRQIYEWIMEECTALKGEKIR